MVESLLVVADDQPVTFADGRDVELKGLSGQHRLYAVEWTELPTKATMSTPDPVTLSDGPGLPAAQAVDLQDQGAGRLNPNAKLAVDQLLLGVDPRGDPSAAGARGATDCSHAILGKAAGATGRRVPSS